MKKYLTGKHKTASALLMIALLLSSCASPEKIGQAATSYPAPILASVAESSAAEESSSSQSLAPSVSSEVSAVSLSSQASSAPAQSASNPQMDESVWDKINSSFYQYDNTTFATNADEHIDMASVTEFFTIDYILWSETGINDLLDQYQNKGSIGALLQQASEYRAVVHDADGFGTAVLTSQGEVGQVYIGDNGDHYKLVWTEGLKSSLQKTKLQLEHVSAKYIGLPAFSTGILFSDGQNEYFYPLEVREDYLQLKTLYPMDEVMNVLVVHKEDLVVPFMSHEEIPVNEQGELDPYCG